jgi:hypothetical protein
MTGTGFAALDPDGSILINTVSTTARGAMVNWLGTEGVRRHGITQPHRNMTDAAIEAAFDRLSDGSKITQVAVTTIQP